MKISEGNVNMVRYDGGSKQWNAYGRICGSGKVNFNEIHFHCL